MKGRCCVRLLSAVNRAATESAVLLVAVEERKEEGVGGILIPTKPARSDHALARQPVHTRGSMVTLCQRKSG